jgi:hypothetical protein
MPQAESTLIDAHEVRAQLEVKYPRDQHPMFDVNLVAFSSITWRNWFHQRIPAEVLPRHNHTLFCMTCLLMAERCTLRGIPMLREQMLIHIRTALFPNDERQSRSDLLRSWGQSQGELVSRLADEVFIDSLGLLSVEVLVLKQFCLTAAEACMQDWTGRGSSSQVAHNVDRIHNALGWECAFYHPSSD